MRYDDGLRTPCQSVSELRHPGIEAGFGVVPAQEPTELPPDREEQADALYHQFANKEELALAVVEWIEETWYAKMAPLISHDGDPVGALIAIARAHAVYCRRDVARVMMTLRVEFNDQDHPVGRAVQQAMNRVLTDCTALITAGRMSGAIPPGPPPHVLALAVMGALEGAVIHLYGREPYDELLAERTVMGLLGLSATSESSADAE